MLVRSIASIATSWSYVGLLFLLLFFQLQLLLWWCWCWMRWSRNSGALKSWDLTAELTSYKVTVQRLLHGIVRVSLRLGMYDIMIKDWKIRTSNVFFLNYTGIHRFFLDVESWKHQKSMGQMMTTRFRPWGGEPSIVWSPICTPRIWNVVHGPLSQGIAGRLCQRVCCHSQLSLKQKPGGLV